MEIIDIIKEAFIFPSNNLDKLAIYVLVMIVLDLFAFGGVISLGYAFANSSGFFILSALLFIISFVISLIITGYEIYILKSGIDFEDDAPSFEVKNDLITGLKMLVVNIVYMIIPAIVAVILALITDLPGNALRFAQEMAVNSANATAIAGSTAPAFTGISEATAVAFGTSISITAIVALIFVVIFAFFLIIAESRLANTGSLGEAINIPETVRDISRIGVGKFLAVVVLTFVVIIVIQGILSFLYSYIPQLAILSVIVIPYLTFFSYRAYGLLYSDIA